MYSSEWKKRARDIKRRTRRLAGDLSFYLNPLIDKKIKADKRELHQKTAKER